MEGDLRSGPLGECDHARHSLCPFDNQRVGFEGRTAVNRKDWGVNWNATLEAGGVLVSEKVNLEFEVSAIGTNDAS